MTIPRGMAVNNPGNIRISDITWLGKITPSSDPDFEEFDNVEHGIRAAALIFINYRRSDGLQTIVQYIARWAPSSDDNPTDEYVGFVATACGVPGNQPYNSTDAEKLLPLLKSVFRYEQGNYVVTEDQIAEGISDALRPYV